MGHDFSTFKKLAKSGFEFTEIDANKLSNATKKCDSGGKEKASALIHLSGTLAAIMTPETP